jgi:hypothetical protein
VKRVVVGDERRDPMSAVGEKASPPFCHGYEMQQALNASAMAERGRSLNDEAATNPGSEFPFNCPKSLDRPNGTPSLAFGSAASFSVRCG